MADSFNPSLALPLPQESSPASEAPSSGVEELVLELFDSLRPSLLRYILSFGVSIHDGEDIVQEAFLSLFRHLQQGRSRANLRGWIFRVVHNISLKRRSANQKFPQLEEQNEMQYGRRPDLCPNAEQLLVNRERQLQLLAVFEALPDQDQQCLRLRAEGLKYREIAEVLGMSLGWVSECLARSLARFQRADGR
jgi:RNA polymerase sigma-70 factor (ECF subfamily)